MRASPALLSLAALTAAPSVSATTPQCKAVSLTVTGTAQNKNITGIPTTSLDALVTFFQSAPAVTVTGPQTLAGTYCEPTVKNANNDKIEVLFGSITTDRGDWTALGGVGTDFPAYNPEMYSWTQFANNKGYATLALDRLGTGKSSHPDPVLVVQAPYEIALYENLASQIRSGTTGQLPRKFNKLYYIGNSYGSQLGAGLAEDSPSSYDDFVLTGFTYDFQQDFVGVTLAGPAPAAVVDPARFGTLDPGFLTTSSETGRTNAFFGSKAQVDFEDQVADLFFQRKNTVSVGQFVSVYGIEYNAPKYTGRVLVLDGENDQAACGPGSPVIGPANCGAQPAMTGQLLFPNAKFNYKTVARTGHAVQFHLSAQKLFGIAHQYLDGQSFAGGPPA